jgi:hypothetical protein
MGLFDLLLVVCGFIKKGNKGSEKNYIVSVLNRNKIPNHKCYKGAHLTNSFKNTNQQCLPKHVQPVHEQEQESDIINVIVSWTHTLCVMAILSVYPFVEITNSSSSTDISFSCIPITQFVFGLIYNSTDHFDKWYEKYKKYNTPKNNLVCVTLFVCACKMTIFISKRKMSWYVYPSIIYGILITSTFTVQFWFVFYKHLLVISEFSNELINGNLTMNYLVEKLTEIKYDIDNSIGLFKNNFAVTSIIGSVGIAYAGICIKDSECSFTSWESVSLFLIYQIVFFIIVRVIDNRKDEINRIVKHTTFIEKYIHRQENLAQYYENDTQMITLCMVEENNTSMDWLLFNYISSDRWSIFKVLGMGFTDGEFFQKGAFLVGILFIVKDFILTFK